MLHGRLVLVYNSYMYITVLGRQPALGIAELEQLYGAANVRWFSDATATVVSDDFDFNRLGGSQKAGKVVVERSGNWRDISAWMVKEYTTRWKAHEGKITLGISAYGLTVTSRDVQKTGITLKQSLKRQGVSLRLVPNAEPALNTAASHHNKLGLSANHIELLIVRGASGKIIVAESVGAQNITALASRDQARPKTDSFVGMLPPKLARIMVNLATGGLHTRGASRALGGGAADANSLHDKAEGHAPPTILDPFCGTGVLLQEAALLGFDVYGTDLSEKMIRYSKENLDWITAKYGLKTSVTLTEGNAMEFSWEKPIAAVATETYLGQPFSAPPSPAKLTEVRGNCNHIISEFLKNIAPQLTSGTPLVVAVPAWNDGTGNFTHLPLVSSLEKLGYRRTLLTHARPEQLLYYREGQVVARELLLLEKS